METAEQRLEAAIIAQLEKVRVLGQHHNQAFIQLLDLLEWQVRGRYKGYLEVGRDVPDLMDRDQRFEIRATGFPKAGDNHVGYSSTLVNANTIGLVLSNVPGCNTVSIVDRSTDKAVIVISGKFRQGAACR